MKTSKSGKKYAVFSTSEGAMTCWDDMPLDVFDESKEGVYYVVWTEKDSYKTLIDLKLVSKAAVRAPEAIKSQGMPFSMALSYAKDLVCAGKIPLEQIEEWTQKFVLMSQSS